MIPTKLTTLASSPSQTAVAQWVGSTTQHLHPRVTRYMIKWHDTWHTFFFTTKRLYIQHTYRERTTSLQILSLVISTCHLHLTYNFFNLLQNYRQHLVCGSFHSRRSLSLGLYQRWSRCRRRRSHRQLPRPAVSQFWQVYKIPRAM